MLYLFRNNIISLKKNRPADCRQLETVISSPHQVKLLGKLQSIPGATYAAAAGVALAAL